VALEIPKREPCPYCENFAGRSVDPDGILVQQHNGTAAFQTVPHIHFHVVPKRADAPFPPADDVPVTPNEDRVRLAEIIRGHWPY
jgi:diadenosine tetraphosphate (Ap4A) HIT family hydrolase